MRDATFFLLMEQRGLNKEDVDHLGYDQEEAYFAKQNRELIEKLRSQREREKKEKEPGIKGGPRANPPKPPAAQTKRKR